MAPHRTGSDWARLLETAAAHGISYKNVNDPQMWGQRYKVCGQKRVVYLEGRLDWPEYAAAFECGIAELVFSHVVPLPVHRRSS